MNRNLAGSYRHCAALARSAPSNFHYSFYLLPRHKRQAMWALYAYLRKTDDLGDSAAPLEAKRSALAAWRGSLASALAGEHDDPILPALVDTVLRFRIPTLHLYEVIDGVQMDLDQHRYATFADLELYCHRVASAVGLACIYIFGFRDERALLPARQCGLAFQLTNILRDLKEDADRGRIYLPQEDLDQFAYSAEELTAGVQDARFKRLMRFQIARAEQFYAEAVELLDYLEPDGRRVLNTMMSTYHQILQQIKLRDGDVFSSRVRLSRWQKMRIAFRLAWAGPTAVLNGASPAGAATSENEKSAAR